MRRDITATWCWGSPCAAEGDPVAPWNVRGWVSVS